MDAPRFHVVLESQSGSRRLWVSGRTGRTQLEIGGGEALREGRDEDSKLGPAEASGVPIRRRRVPSVIED